MSGYLVLDIETVPDLTAWQPKAIEEEIPRIKQKIALTKGDQEFMASVWSVLTDKKPMHAKDIEKAKELVPLMAPPDVSKLTELLDQFPDPDAKDQMAPVYAQRPIAIGCLWLSDTLEFKNLGCMGVSKYGDDERELLLKWNEFMNKEHPAVVTWNGRGFDIPVLALRSFRWGVPQPWSNKDFRYRYNEDKHIDLLELMTDYGAVFRNGFKLDAISKLIGLPGKYGIDGSQVARIFAEGGIERIENYCQTDVITTAFILMRFFLIRGKLNIESYRKCVNGLLQKCLEMPHFKEFTDIIDQDKLLLQDKPLLHDNPPLNT